MHRPHDALDAIGDLLRFGQHIGARHDMIHGAQRMGFRCRDLAPSQGELDGLAAPARAFGTENTVLLPATRIWQASASSRAPPMQTPSSASSSETSSAIWLKIPVLTELVGGGSMVMVATRPSFRL